MVQSCVVLGILIVSFPLALAVEHGKDHLASLLIERGANVHMRVGKGRTLLMIAVAHADEGLVRLLLDSGSDRGARDESGMKASAYIQMAERVPREHQEKIVRMVEEGA